MTPQSKWRVVLYIFLGVVGWFALSRLSAPSVDEGIHQRQVEAVLHAGKAYRAQIQRDSETIAQLRRTATSHTAKADSLHAKADTIRLPQITPAACFPYSQRLSLCEAETRELRAALKADSAALDTATIALRTAGFRADTLETLLRTTPKPCRILGVACPKVSMGVFVDAELHPRLGVGLAVPLF